MALYQAAALALAELGELKRRRLIAPVWTMVVANSFFYDSPESFVGRLWRVLEILGGGRPREGRAPIFLTGSPVFFPNLKIPLLIEEAGLEAAADDLCSSERLLPGPTPSDDPSWQAMAKALGQRYHQGCTCPTFVDNDRRVHNILASPRRRLVKGVVFHVLKGCHPYDLESLSLEGPLMEAGLRFLRLETDYAAEDAQNVLTRLEAFRASMGGDRR
jgi:benzoyl-CoA reductase/2-hydroxyglutaryl-CoA dehydratase subunit BcrC/BadD/HgdB